MEVLAVAQDPLRAGVRFERGALLRAAAQALREKRGQPLERALGLFLDGFTLSPGR